MAIDIEKVLLARSAREAEEAPSTQAVAIGGAIAGATVGGLAGQGVHMVVKGINAVRNKQPKVFKPGPRMAGGLLGAVLGGALGAGTRDMMVQNSPAAALLAKCKQVILAKVISVNFSKSLPKPIVIWVLADGIK